MSANSDQKPATVDVRITNWPVEKNQYANGIARTTFHTYIVDPAVGWTQISDMEPGRKRLVIIANECDVQVTLETPTSVADGTTSSLAGQGAYLPKSSQSREFYGPDAMWLKPITGQTAGRVTVVKEYC